MRDCTITHLERYDWIFGKEILKQDTITPSISRLHKSTHNKYQVAIKEVFSSHIVAFGNDVILQGIMHMLAFRLEKKHPRTFSLEFSPCCKNGRLLVHINKELLMHQVILRVVHILKETR